MIQSVYKYRLDSFQMRVKILAEIWDQIKNEMTKYLMVYKKQPKKAKQMSMKIIQTAPEIKQEIFKTYIEYCKQCY